MTSRSRLATFRSALRLAVLGAGLLVPAAAVAQDARLEARLDPRTRAAVVALIDSARAVGLPAEALVQKALEGASKGAPPARIVAAVRLLSQEMSAARLVLGPGAGEAEIVAGAGALKAGASVGSLVRLRTARPGVPLTIALGVLTDLIARTVPADTAAGAVIALAGAGASDDDLIALRRSVERDIVNGLPPQVALARGASGRPAVSPAGRPASAAVGGELSSEAGTRGDTKPRPRRP